MQGISKEFFRHAQAPLSESIAKGRSVLLLGPRQVGKTWLVERCLPAKGPVLSVPLHKPDVRQDYERDPGLLARRVAACADPPVVFVDEAQKAPALFDAAQELIDKRKATVVFTGSSARKLRRGGANLLPGRVLAWRLDPLMWGEAGWAGEGVVPELRVGGCGSEPKASSAFADSLVYGCLPGLVSQADLAYRAELLRSYAHIFVEEEVRAEALTRNLGAFVRFLELAAAESGCAPNLQKLSMESGVSGPTVKAYYSILEDTLVVEPVPPYLKNARKRVLQTPRYYFFDVGVRNALARVPLTGDLVRAQPGLLFEHAVILEIIRRARALRRDYRVCFWRTSSGLEVDCVVDCGTSVVPIEIKSARRVTLADLAGLRSFLEDYAAVAHHGYVVTMGDAPEKLADNITAVPWHML